ncbi:hypothetical protein [Natrialba sp. INN-245]|uniref:hypothetical protein n=1 Tax=Natrialba sp. INN-245 TaxID=2690967 RepID=UPI0013109263|nr:hypothetical protein [Natrialba sp. INN-245]MWV41785.1 hypothetical protein [Natrialba sp. INN-245]
MNFDLDGGKLLYALGVVFALVALLYFVQDVVFGLSITVRAVLLFALFAGFFVGGVAIDRGALDVVSFALAAISYAVFIGYVVSRYDPGETGIFLALTASAALFVGLGYAVRERGISVSVRTAGIVVVALLCLSLVLVGADVLGGGVTYETSLEESVTVTAPEDVSTDRDGTPVEVSVGTATATNGFVFARPLEHPAIYGCMAGTDDILEDEVPIRYEPSSYRHPDAIGGNAEHSAELTARVLLDDDVDETTLSVERDDDVDDCDVTRSEPTLVVVVDEGE